MSNAKASKVPVIIIALVLAGAGLAVFGFLRRERVAAIFAPSDAPSSGTVPVQTEGVARRDIAEFVTAGGKIQPLVLVKISPEVSGEIVALPLSEGRAVKKGDLIVRLKPDTYAAARSSTEAAYKAAVANQNLAKAMLERMTFEFARTRELYRTKLVSDSQLQEAKTAYDVALAQSEVSGHQAEMARSAVTRADEDLAKTSLFSPISGVVAKLSSQLGERVVGTATMAGTEIMQIADLNQMEVRVDVGEGDVVLIQPGQPATLDVDAVRGAKFSGVVTDIANIPNNVAPVPGGKSQEATKFEVRIRVNEKGPFRPGMSASAVIQTRSRTNVLSVPIQCVTTRIPTAPADAKAKPGKPIEVVFLVDGERVRMVPIVRGISDESYVEIASGLSEGKRVVTGSYKAINRDLQDGMAIKILGP